MEGNNNGGDRVKFLCSFGGSILPRPGDGKLRYVGGETRIVSVARDISYVDLLGRMRELYESTSILKYQQPDDDLDSLVSVVNDDDVVNMMDEYDKLGFGYGRIFLFDSLSSCLDGFAVDFDSERRYVDALNSVLDDFSNSFNLEAGLLNHRSNLRPCNNEDAAQGSWSPAFYSPRCDYPTSPSSARFRFAFQDVSDKGVDRLPDEVGLPHIPFDPPPQYADSVLWLPPGGVAVDRGGFPGNILNGHAGLMDRPTVCEHCKMTFQRNPPSAEYHWKAEGGLAEQSPLANGYPQVADQCVECVPMREPVLLNSDPKLQHSMSGVGRMGENYNLDASGASIAMRPSNFSEGPTTYAHLEDPRYIRAGAELGGEAFHGQAGSQVHVPLEERGVLAANLPYSYGTADIAHQALHSHSAQAMWRNVPTPVHVSPVFDPSNAQLRNGVPSPVVPRANVEASPRYYVGVDQSPWGESSRRRFGVEGTASPENPYAPFSNMSAGAPFLEVNPTVPHDPLINPPSMANIPLVESPTLSELPSTIMSDNMLSSGAIDLTSVLREDSSTVGVILDERSILNESRDTIHLRTAKHPDLPDLDGLISPQQNNNNNTEKSSIVASVNAIMSNNIRPCEDVNDGIGQGETNTCLLEEKADLSFLPELVASAKKAKLESVERVKARAQDDGNPERIVDIDETGSPDADGNSEGGSDENIDTSKIEHTKAEDEALAKGLQIIYNADLEEIRLLGSGTYGAVYHGKWKGSDVAIKRIKASCFAGRPSERERLIADFWKEAFLLSSLHHPNVVSFYGIVRDGPDGTLATVTEFMINGSLKQYLQKKDRTIDRRKRLIIAMDAAFGMEYLHGKNIVHFDLKCENLLVNMRDPHRPVCKIGDLGLSKVKQHTLVSGGVRGTLPWMAPELLSGKSNMVTEKIDVYSFGIVMWELLTGEEPYSNMHCASIIGGIVNNTLRPQIPTWCDPEWKSLMESCWGPDPANRPSFTEISQKLRSMAAAMNVK